MLVSRNQSDRDDLQLATLMKTEIAAELGIRDRITGGRYPRLHLEILSGAESTDVRVSVLAELYFIHVHVPDVVEHQGRGSRGQSHPEVAEHQSLIAAQTNNLRPDQQDQPSIQLHSKPAHIAGVGKAIALIHRADQPFRTRQAAGEHAALLVVANPELPISEFFNRRPIRCLSDQRGYGIHGVRATAQDPSCHGRS